MEFPNTERVIYSKNPLMEVVCQIKFPTLLKIEVNKPSEFQEKIRSTFPIYNEISSLQLPPDIPPQIAALIAKDMGATSRNYEFHTRDKNFKLTLSKDFIALKASQYSRWEDFKSHLLLSLKSLNEIYDPAFYNQIGLRYINVIKRSILNLNDNQWCELIHENILGFLNVPEMYKSVESCQSRQVIQLSKNNAKVLISHGLAIDEEDKEECFILDADFQIIAETEYENANTSLDYLNTQSRNLFRWCIKQKLHDAMEPAQVTSE